MKPEGYADKSMEHEQQQLAGSAVGAVDWQALYLAERQRADQLAALLKRRHSLDPIEVAEALTDYPPAKDAS